MIPKTIHYCWFGRGKMPKLIQKCIKSWKRYCPDWKIVRWDEDSFNVNSILWTKQAYEAKKYAFVADYVRMKVLAEQGGVYLDTDQELIKPLEPFRCHKAFMGFMGKACVSAGVIGAEKGHPVIVAIHDYYLDRPFFQDQQQDSIPNTEILTDLLVEKGLKLDDTYQEVEQLSVYPQTYFCPTSCISVESVQSKDTVSLHHWAMSWRSPYSRRVMKRTKRRTTKTYKFAIWLRYLPSRTLRKIFGDAAIDKLRGR